MKSGAITVEVVPGLRLVGDLYGEGGPPVILLHGGGQTRHSWRRTARALAAAGFRALVFDQRGHGDSDRAPGKRYTFFDFAADSRALALHAASRFGAKPAVVGASLGGLSALIATDLGEESPFAALVLVDVTPRMDPAGVQSVHGFMRQKAETGFLTVEEAAESIAAYLPHRPRPRSLDGLRKNLRPGQDGRLYWHWDRDFIDGPYAVGNHRGDTEAAALKAAARLAIPSLLVRGAASELVRQEQADEYLALARGSRFVDVGGAHHMVVGDSNEAFTAAVADFLREVMVATVP